jgi:hypothetical protein
MERLNLTELSDVEAEEKHQIKTPNRFAAMENLNDNADVIRV